MIKAFKENVDIHTLTASEVFDLPIELDGTDNELFHIYYFQWNVKPQEEYSRFYFMSADGDLKYRR